MDDLYDGFDDMNDENTINTMNTTISTSFTMNDSIRPMTSNKSAGYSSQTKRKSKLNIYQADQKKSDVTLNNNINDSLSEKAEMMEQNVNKLLRESIFYSSCGDYKNALDFALKSRKKENEIIIFREKHNLDDNINQDLRFCVLFNLGYIYELKEMYSESLNIYNEIVCSNLNKTKIRINIGNIYYKQNKYDLAIKMYRMSLDEIGDLNYKLKINILRNIGNAFIKLGEFVEAIQSFENIIDICNGDIDAIFNLIISYYILGDKEKLKKGFLQLLNCYNNNNIQNTKEDDEYSIYIAKKKCILNKYMKQSVQLIAKAIGNNNDEYSGYDWLLHQIKERNININIKNIILQLKSIAYFKDNKFCLGINNCINNNNNNNNNLSFIKFLCNDFVESNKYAVSAILSDRYNALSLVNRANCLYIFGEYDSAKEMYLEAIGVEADCMEAIYNLGLICKKIGNYNDALQAFKKLNKSLYHNPQILYQISHLYELLNEYETSIKWYKILHSVVPNDSNVLIKLANLSKIYLKDENLIFHNYLDSYKLYKCNINILSWLGIWYINNSLFENAINIFENAFIIQPKQIKWKFMIASCYRRMRNFQKSIQIYESILNENNENINLNIDINITQKCLQYLCTIMKQINHPQLNKYQIKLQEIQEMQEIQEIQEIHMENHTENQDVEQKQEHQQEEEQQQEDIDNNNWNDIHIDDELLPS